MSSEGKESMESYDSEEYGPPLHPGDGWEFCKSADAVQWYDFRACRWKAMYMAGYFLGDCQAFRRRASA